MTQRSARRPAEGWITLALVAALALIVAWAIDEPAWVLGRGALTDFLPACALLGVAAGFAGPKVGWGRWTTHLVGAMFAALLIPVLAGFAAYDGYSVGQAFHEVAGRSVKAYLDLAWRGMSLTPEEIHYSVVFGIIVWGTAQFASYAVFGHRRPLAAIAVMGTVLLVDMAVWRDSPSQLNYLILFTAGSLFLLIQMHALDERATWIRRRIGDPSTMSSMYLRGGTVFILAAMVGSTLLTQRAASAPLAGAWTGMSDRLIGLGEDISLLLPFGGDSRPMGKLRFGDTVRISPQWVSDATVAFTATVPKDYQVERWRAATYDTFLLTGWDQTKGQTVAYAVEAGQALLEMSPESPRADLTTEVQVKVNPAGYSEAKLLVPGAPLTVDRAANTILFGSDRSFASVDFRDGDGGSYIAKAAVLRIETDKGKDAQGVTEGKLRNAGDAYPPELIDRYTTVPTGAVGEAAELLLRDILAASPSRNPYDLAVTMEAYLRSDRFDYDTDLTDDPRCDVASAVECFAQIRRGACLHFASTMAILLREANPDDPIPTRLVQGFLPGKSNGSTTTVRIRDGHAWVEVYFPYYGWIPFDPTPDVGLGSDIPPGQAVPPPSIGPVPSSSFGLDEIDPKLGPAFPPPGGDDSGGTTDRGGGGPDRAVLMTLAILLGLTILVLAVVAWLRGPRGEVSPDAAWKTMARMASRFGYAQRPTQTVYEYATTLGDLVPVAERDIQVIASAKVETNYARVQLGGARLDAVKDATRRLRISLLRLLFRRPRRRRRA